MLSRGLTLVGLPKASARCPCAHHIDTIGIGAPQCIKPMTPPDRLDAIEIKLSHLEASLQDLDQALVRQQREIALLAARNRALEQQVEELANGGGQAGIGFEKPPHY